MRGMTPRRLLLPLLLLALYPAAARADGPPVTSLDAGPEGVLELSGGDRFTALQTRRGTVLTQSQTRGGRVVRAVVLPGRWGVPVVANDGTSGGLSADSTTLVLMRVARAYPRRQSRFAVVDTGPLAVRHEVELDGEWGFDALSPDGSTLYLIEQLSRRDRTRYAVRAYDLRARRLLPEPVVDPAEPDEPMRGLAVTRTTGPRGRWEYTLYAGGEHPFIHALDTVRRESICIDLPHRVARHRRLYELRIVVRGHRLELVDGDRVVAAASRPQQASTGGGPPWAAAVLLVTGLMAAAGWRGSRRRSRVSTAADGDRGGVHGSV
jgi:hypothetical protein